MGLRFTLAKAVGRVLTVGLRDVLHRPAANMPGKIALYVDPHLIADLRGRLREGSIVVAGTNGKTSTTNLLADALETAGATVVCNRTGANLDSGVSTSLLQTKGADWGVFESDELWLAKILPGLQPRYVLLLNLFRDQLDRVGEIERIQDSIAGALATSPNTVLVYNADDPLCARIAESVDNPSVPFGISEDLHLTQNRVTDAQMCQRCEGMVSYTYRQYGQLGDYRCESCGFARPELQFAAHDVKMGADGMTFAVREGDEGTLLMSHSAENSEGELDANSERGIRGVPSSPADVQLKSEQSSPYLIYNLLAAYAACCLMGVSAPDLQRAIDRFDPRNGRLQAYAIGSHRVLLNLAKNPTGFNQNLRIVERDANPKAVAFFINDKEADGRDVSWIWDIDFEELASQPDCLVFAGGRRKYDVQVRLKYADVTAEPIDSIDDVFARIPDGMPVYAIANYTSLPAVKAALDAQEAQREDAEDRDFSTPPASQAPVEMTGNEPADKASSFPSAHESASEAPTPYAISTEVDKALTPYVISSGVSEANEVEKSQYAAEREPVVILHVYPDLLNLYGDGGNVRILQQRLAWRGIPVEVREVHYGEPLDLSQADIVFLGGGPDREQKLACEELMKRRDELARYVEDDGVVLAICGGYQILGRKWLLGDELVKGLDILGLETRRPGTSADRLVGNIVLASPLADMPVVGYENHAGRTYLDKGVQPFGKVVSHMGAGNNENDKADGVLCRNVVGTYLHGPLLAKNPQLADYILTQALGERNTLSPLDDAAENRANAFMRK